MYSWDSGSNMEKYINNLTCYKSLIQFKDSKNTALYFRSKKIDYISLCKRVDEVADKLYSLGVRKDMVVSLLAPNVIETVEVFYALNKIGAIISILHPLISKVELKESILEANSKMLIILDARYSDYFEIIDELNIPYYFISAYKDLRAVTKLGFKLLYSKQLKKVNKEKYLYKIKCNSQSFKINEDNLKPSIYLRSGGTTGKSKTVIINDYQALFAPSLSKEIIKQDVDNKSMLAVLPFFHGFGLAMGLLAPLNNNASSHLMINFSSRIISKEIKHNRINMLLVIPYMCEKLLDNKHFNSRNLIATFMGADKPDIKLFDKYNKKTNSILLEGYGLTETVSVNFVNTIDSYKVGSVGKPLRYVRFKIVKDDDYITDIGPNKKGIILINSPSVCLGYLNSESPFYFDTDGNKWLVTNDVGYYDNDGYLYVLNRKDDVFKIAGYNIFPSEIENIVNSFTEVNESKVIYIKNSKHPYIKLFIECKQIGNEKLLKDSIKKEIVNKLNRYSVPEEIIIVKKMPRTSLGKIDIDQLN